MQTSDPFSFFIHNLSLFASKTAAHLELSFVAIGVAIVLAIPLGVWLGHVHRGSFLAITVSNIGRALPSLAVISIGIGILGIGFLNVMVALVILAGPVILTNAYVAVEGVDADAVQAARAMGMTPLQVLLRVELPLGLPLIFAGVRTATVYVVATATLATFAGGGGLGDIIVNEPTYGTGGVIAGSLWIVVLIFAVDGLFGLVQRLVTPYPLRRLGRKARTDALIEASWEPSSHS
ncbi:MAG: ABC transporter permease [Solirubrobacterales bacterium]|nr:ABC transporter permease [Solirubrobacterales bacterium]MBV9421665.1 ABC transporter permease [Solirubrobacterales bacterium]MBV9800786.1 ABC transporter permease [Solirubrobacterales bacterium]